MKRFAYTPTPLAVCTALCGVAIAVSSFLPWISARDARPAAGLGHTSFSQMLVYTFTDSPFLKSVGFVVLILGVLMIIGALTGLRALAAGAGLLALVTGGIWIGLITHHYNTPDLPNLHYLSPANLPWSDLNIGAWLLIASAFLGLLSALLSYWKSGKEAA